MRVTALGHAGLKVETSTATVLVDPWFSPEGAFQASWFQFPENSHLMGPDLLRPSAVLISHEHLDHIDPWFLRQVDPSVPVIVPSYPSPVLRAKLEAAGRSRIIEVPSWERREVADGVDVLFVAQESPMHHDAAIVLFADGQTVLDMNDAKLSPVQLRSINHMAGGTVDVFAFQASGASWYPMCYRYPEERQRELSAKKRAAKLAYALSMTRVLDPVTAMPFAGPACFLDQELFLHNEEMEGGVFPDQEQVAEWLRDRSIDNAVVLLPGDAWDVDARMKHADPTWEGFSFEDRRAYLEAYAERRQDGIASVLARYPEPTDPIWDRFREYFQRLLSMSSYFNRRIGMRVGFEVRGPGGGRWAVDFRPGHEGVSEEMGECPYVLSFASRWLPPILDGTMPWEDFFLSLRFEAERHPDLYNAHLIGLLKFADPEALAAVQEFETTLDEDERIIVHSEGRSYSVSRFCPHAGNDLEATGEVLPGRVLRCTAHRYEFSLDTGACLNGMGLSLDVEPLEHPVDAGARPAGD